MTAGQSAELEAGALGPRRLVAWLGVTGLFAALAYVGRFASGAPADDVLYEYTTAVAFAIQGAFFLAVMVLIAVGLPKRPVFALRAPESWGRAALLCAGVLVGIYVAVLITEPLLHGGEEQGLTPDGWDPDRAGAYAANFVAAALFAPVVEELTYRGIGFTLVRRFFDERAAIAVTALMFGLAHGLVAGLPALALFGAGLAYVRARTGSVYPCIALHATFNAIALVAAVAI